MEKFTQYFRYAHSNPHMVKMTLPSSGKKITYDQYNTLVRVMGLMRDPNGVYFLGGWEAYVLPNGNLFLMDLC